jgi:DNA replication protein DnaC
MGATIASTNLSTAELAQYYDARVLDRMREMMSIVNFGNEESFRRM